MGFLGRGTVMALLERFYDPNSGGDPGDTDKDPEWTKILGGLEWFGTCFMTFQSVGNFIIPTDELHHFSEG